MKLVLNKILVKIRDNNYFRISLYAVCSFGFMYAIKLLMDATAYFITNINNVLSAAAGFFGALFSVLSPLVIAFVIAYLLDPITEFYQSLYDDKIKLFFNRRHLFRHKASNAKNNDKKAGLLKIRVQGAFMTFLSIFLIIALIIIFIFKKLGEAGDGLYVNIMLIITRTVNDFTDAVANVHISIKEWGLSDYLSGYISAFLSTVGGFIENTINGIITSSGGGISAGSVINAVIGVTVAYYFLLYKYVIINRLNEIAELFLKSKIKSSLYCFLSKIHNVFSGYIRGQLIEMVIMSILFSAALYIIGLKYAVLIGIFSGIANIIPYVGGIMGFVLSVAVALIGGQPVKAIYAAVVIIILQQIDSMIVIPKVVGKRMDVSPPQVLLSISIGNKLFGITGMLLAAPVSAVIKLLFEGYLDRRRNDNKT